MRPGLLVLLLLASVLVLGCAGEEPDEPNRKWVLVGTDSLTGFYVGKTEGGLLTVRVEDYEYLARRPPTTPPIVPPTEVYGMLYPDHADTLIQLTGTMHGSHGTVSFTMRSSDYYLGTGYNFSGTYSYQTLSFGGAFTSPSDTGYFGGYVGSIDSVQVYCGSFAGDSLHGQWHFAVLATVLKGAGIASDTSVVLGYNGTVSQSGGNGLVTLAGTANGELGLSGAGTLGGETGSGTWALSGDFDAGTWTADRMRPDSTTARFQKLATQ
jgi:hypothetical protein